MQSQLPTRHGNPFATCWTRPGALAFQFAPGDSAEALVTRLAAAGGWGEIVGPHGSGKSTLLRSLESQLAVAGWRVAAITLRDGQRRLPGEWLRTALGRAAMDTSKPLLIIDGYEQLSWFARLRLKWRCRIAGAGLLVTSHASTGLPTIYRTQVDLALVAALVSTLTAHRTSPITQGDIAASHACHGSNLRELLFALYDRHELLLRRRRTVEPQPA
jgi:hypothetical protein